MINTTSLATASFVWHNTRTMTPQFAFLAVTGFNILFYVMTLTFVIFAVCTAYHWFTYGSSKRMSTISLAVFLGVSAPLFIVMSITLSLM